MIEKVFHCQPQSFRNELCKKFGFCITIVTSCPFGSNLNLLPDSLVPLRFKTTGVDLVVGICHKDQRRILQWRGRRRIKVLYYLVEWENFVLPFV